MVRLSKKINLNNIAKELKENKTYMKNIDLIQENLFILDLLKEKINKLKLENDVLIGQNNALKRDLHLKKIKKFDSNLRHQSKPL